jgi:predicted RNase H-like nuclease (RuvC/YqgF family)
MGTIMAINKEQQARALVVLLDLENEDYKELMKMKATVLFRMFEGQKKNAVAYQNMYELSKRKYI